MFRAGQSKLELIGLDGTRRATLFYELFKLTGRDEHREQSIEVFRNLFESTPNIQYKKKIDELEAG